MRCRRAAVRFELPRAVSRRHDVARSSNLLLRNWKRLEKLLIIGSARSSAPRVAKNVAEGGETVREIVKPKSRRVSGGSRCGGLRASQRGFPWNTRSTRPLLGIHHLSSLVWYTTNTPCKGYGACEYTTLRLVERSRNANGWLPAHTRITARTTRPETNARTSTAGGRVPPAPSLQPGRGSNHKRSTSTASCRCAQ